MVRINLKRSGFFWFCGVMACTSLLVSSCASGPPTSSGEDPGRLYQFLSKVEGATRCGADYRISSGDRGHTMMRLYLVDELGHVLPLAPLKKSEAIVDVRQHFSIRESSVQVLDAETGERVSGVTGALSLSAARPGKAWIQPNPHDVSLQERFGKARVPRAIALSIDMSETSEVQDPFMVRGVASATWSLERLYGGKSLGDPDRLAVLLMRNHTFSKQDNLFLAPDQPLPGPPADALGFAETDQVGKEGISASLIGLSNDQVLHTASLYGTIQESARLARKAGWDAQGQPLRHVAAITISASQDAHTLGVIGVQDHFADAKAALRGTDGRAVPFMAITYPKPDRDKQEDWDRHLDRLCELTQASGKAGDETFGQVFQVRQVFDISSEERYARLQGNVRRQLDRSVHAMGGFLEVKVNYQLMGAVPGKRYIVSFVVDADLFGHNTKRSTDAEQAHLSFEVRL